MYKSMGFKTGPDFDNLRDAAVNDMYDAITAEETFTRYVEIGIESNRDLDPPLYIVQDKPYPFTPLGMLIEME
jgi:hypothetical protein